MADSTYIENVLVTPCNDDYMFQLRFLKENVWFEVSVADSKIEEVEYVAIYRAAPVQAITHIGKVREATLYGNTGKYIFHLEDVKPLDNSIIWNKGDHVFRSRMYFNLDEMRSSATVSELLGKAAA